ncbi:MAG: deoxyguanosinetriphosphate triphosphohydrolase [Hyphomicrobiales bacterium]|nr:deoxyguanosinetriphosphate triphosphohydrolase [Hyphomicrobiales bacterium]
MGANAKIAAAADASTPRARLHREPPSPTRDDFQRDRDRVLHAAAFRRLAHKTQVFVPIEGDHFRTRLTHTIEVAQIARALARGLGLDEALADTVALAHDLGHTPFGHTGEDALAACMAAHGGFDHNAQALAVVTRLERRYAGFDGLNLCFESLEGLVKHNGPLTGPHARDTAAPDASIVAFDRAMPLGLDLHAGAEAQAAALADDIAYDAHDLDDGLRAGLFSLDALRGVDFLRDALGEIARLHPGLEPSRATYELTRRVITRFVEDALAASAPRLAGLSSFEDVRRAEGQSVGFSPALAAADRAIKAFLYPAMYRHPDVMRVRREADSVVRRLFERFLADPAAMPADWAKVARDGDPARAVADYVAGMTDRYALSEHRRLFGSAPEMR